MQNICKCELFALCLHQRNEQSDEQRRTAKNQGGGAEADPAAPRGLQGDAGAAPRHGGGYHRTGPVPQQGGDRFDHLSDFGQLPFGKHFVVHLSPRHREVLLRHHGGGAPSPLRRQVDRGLCGPGALAADPRISRTQTLPDGGDR